MRENWCGQHDCYDCYHLVEFERNVNICLLHKVQIVPQEGAKCQYWRWEDDGPDDLHDNDAVERQIQKNDQSLSHKE